MKVKRLISLILTIVFFMSMTGYSHAEQTVPVHIEEKINCLSIPDLWKQELYHGVQLGIPMDKADQSTLSGAEMMELLDWFVAYAAPDKFVDWKDCYPVLRRSTDPLRRIDAMAALFLAADLIGGDYYGHNLYVWDFVQAINHNWDLEETWLTGSLFGEAAQRSSYYGGSFGACYLDAAGFYYNASRPSTFSGQYPFPFDEKSNSYQLSVPLTFADGVLAIVRLIASTNAGLFAVAPVEKEMQYLVQAENRKKEIRLAVSDIASATGSVYYISNNGSDANDGLSPETAWATPYKAMTADLKYGDTILFERGHTWYLSVEDGLGETTRNHGYTDGMIIGAYGEGEKPVLRGDIERANQPSFWELYYDQNGKKIWKASEMLRDCAVIVFNNGEACAEEIFPWLNDALEYIAPDGTPLVIEDFLSRNLTFCNLLTIEDNADVISARMDSYQRGELYLRCDEGNPAEVFDAVSVPQEPVGLDLFPNSRVYDLSLLYFTMMGTQGTDIGTTPENYQFVNLEVGWCGGWVQNYAHQEMAGISYGYKPHIAGGGIGIYQTGLQVLNCYIHHCGPMAMIESIHDHIADDGKSVLHADQLFSSNLFEYCGAPLHWTDLSFLEVPGSQALISNMVFENNLVMNSGEGWIYKSVAQSDGGGANSYWLSAVENGMGAANNEGIYIRNNTFYLSQYALITLDDYLTVNAQPVNAQPVFDGNTFVQLVTKPLLQKNKSTEIYYPAEQIVKELLGDQTGELVVIDRTKK